MVVVPNVAPDTPPLRRNPVFMYSQDGFQRPNPFRPDVAVAIDSVIDKKIQAIDAHVSQFYEWLPWVDGKLDTVPKEPAARLAWLQQWRSFRPLDDDVKAALRKWYGPKADAVKNAEAFEVCEYGRRRARPTCGGCSRSSTDPGLLRRLLGSLGWKSYRYGQRLGLGSAPSKGRRKRVAVLHHDSMILRATSCAISGCLGQGSSLGDQSGHVGTGRPVSPVGERLDIEANEGLLDVLPDSAASRHSHIPWQHPGLRDGGRQPAAAYGTSQSKAQGSRRGGSR